MLKKILVPFDGSKISEKILHQVRRLLVQEDAKTLLLRVVPPGPNRGSEEAEVAEAAQHLREQGGDAQHALVQSADPATGILACARRYRPSLIAMSTHGRTGLKRLTRGSVAERVLRASPFPLLLWNPFRPSGIGRGGSARFRKILVPLDGSKASARILPLVKAFARLNAARVTLLHVVTLTPTVGEYAGIVLTPSTQDIKKVLEPSRRLLRGVTASIRVELGFPSESILAAAQREEADLIAMTTHGRSGISRWAFGSVAENVLRHSPLPLLIQRSA